MTEVEKMKVIIAGGGIGGVCAAHALIARGIDVTVYEKAGDSREVGAALMLTPNSTRLLAHIGLLERLRSIGVQTRAAVRRSALDMSLKYGMTLGVEAEELFGAPLLHLHRGELLGTLSDALPPGVLHLNRRVVGFGQDAEGVRLELEGGETVVADLLVAADGSQSRIRSALFAPAERVFRKGWSHRALIPRDSSPLAREFADAATLTFFGDAQAVGFISFAGPHFLNTIVGTPGWDLDLPDGRTNVPVTHEEVMGFIQDWDPRLQDLLSHAGQFVRWPMYDTEPLDTWSRGRVTLLGDAAHAMLPTYGQGASQTIEDGFALAHALAVHGDSVGDALAQYEAVRIPRTREIQIGARRLSGTGRRTDGDLVMAAQPMQPPGDGRFVSGVGLGLPPDPAAIYRYDLHAVLNGSQSPT